MALGVAALALPYVAKGIGSLFGRRRSSTQAPDYRQELRGSAAAARQEADAYRKRDENGLDSFRRRLTGYQQRVANPQTYRPAYDAAYGQGASAGAYDAAHARANIAASMPGYDTSTVAGANQGVAEAQLGNLAQLRARLMQQQLAQQAAGEREALDLEGQYVGMVGQRSAQQQAQYLDLLRYLLGDQSSQQELAVQRQGQTAGLLGGLAQAYATYMGANR